MKPPPETEDPFQKPANEPENNIFKQPPKPDDNDIFKGASKENASLFDAKPKDPSKTDSLFAEKPAEPSKTGKEPEKPPSLNIFDKAPSNKASKESLIEVAAPADSSQNPFSMGNANLSLDNNDVINNLFQPQPFESKQSVQLFN